MFYNVENLFDPEDDSTKNDNDFTPNSKKHWTYNRLHTKLEHITQVIIAAGQWELPAIVGMCEVENRLVLEMLQRKSTISKYRYQIVHYDSPDARGIDVAAIYRPDLFKVVASKPIRLTIKDRPHKKTRDILYIKGVALASKDTLHIFVNHWPSKLGGAAASDPYRLFAAQTLKKAIDSIIVKNHNSKVIVMGDFNDEPDSKSIQELTLNKSLQSNNPSILINLATPLMKAGKGTNNYRGRWSAIDQIMVSQTLINSRSGLTTSSEKFRAVSDDFLLVSNRNNEKVPFRTYSGPQYLGGYSDHLPIIVELNIVKP